MFEKIVYVTVSYTHLDVYKRQGYMRLMHFDLDNEKIIIRTFSPSHGGTEYENYGDYDAKPSENPNVGNEFCIEDANLNDAETFEIPFACLLYTSSQQNH